MWPPLLLAVPVSVSASPAGLRASPHGKGGPSRRAPSRQNWLGSPHAHAAQHRVPLCGGALCAAWSCNKPLFWGTVFRAGPAQPHLVPPLGTRRLQHKLGRTCRVQQCMQARLCRQEGGTERIMAAWCLFARFLQHQGSALPGVGRGWGGWGWAAPALVCSEVSGALAASRSCRPPRRCQRWTSRLELMMLMVYSL